MPLTPEERRARQRIYQRRYYLKNKELVNAKAREWQGKNLAYYRNQQKEAATRRNEITAGRPRPDHCEICGNTDRRIAFDHCHQRGVFRGWICYPCNIALGAVKDDPNRLRMLIAYLERTKDIISPQLTLSGV